MRDKKHRSKIIDSLLFLILIAILIASSSTYAAPTEVWVDSKYNSSTSGWNLTHFSTIQSAINGVADSGTVTVRPGTYFENLLIEKPILLTGESEYTALVDGQGKDFTIDIRSGDVKITDLKLTNTGTFDNWAVYGTGPGNITVDNNYFLDKGIFIGTNNCTITNNRIEGQGSIFLSSAWNNTVDHNYVEASFPGQIWLYGKSSNNTITNNTIIGEKDNASCTGIRSVMSHNNLYANNQLKNFRVHILLTCSNNNILTGNTIFGYRLTKDEVGGGIVLYRSSNNWVASNDISSVIDGGIMLFGDANENQILSNTIRNAERGIELYMGSERNNIINNAILNSIVGFRLVSSKNNKLIHNNVEVKSTQAYDDSVNSWSEDGSGNYWGRYDGTDADEDGIGDSSQPIPPNTEDPAPLISPAAIESPEIPTLEPVPYDLVFSSPIIIDDDVIWENQSIELTSRISIKNGGYLTLKNTTLNIKTDNDFVAIDVNEGGTLEILDSSLFSQGPCIWALKGSTLHVENSLLNKLGVWDGDGAVQIACDNSIIKNNIIDGGYAGVKVHDGASKIEFVGNTVRNVRIGLDFCCIASQENNIEGNVFENIIDHAIGASNGFRQSRIVENQFLNVWGEPIMISYPGPGNKITDNTYESCPPYIDRQSSDGNGSGGCTITTIMP